jgi:hypothetical protein
LISIDSDLIEVTSSFRLLNAVAALIALSLEHRLLELPQILLCTTLIIASFR